MIIAVGLGVRAKGGKMNEWIGGDSPQVETRTTMPLASDSLDRPQSPLSFDQELIIKLRTHWYMLEREVRDLRGNNKDQRSTSVLNVIHAHMTELGMEVPK